MTQKILLDTDIGTDIDDAVCLAYLLAHPDCDLSGITTVSGQAVKRAAMADVMCRVAGKNVPIYPGCEYPLIVPVMQSEARQADALVNWAHTTDFRHGHAIEFMRETIRSHPGEITLIGIGAMTNIALLFTIDPQIPSMLKQLVLMCGLFKHHLDRLEPLEWNARQDPHATAIVYNHDVDVHRSISADVTSRVRMPKDEVIRRFSGIRLLEPVLDFAEIFFETSDEVIFHDPLTAATIFDESICEMERGTVEVELHSSRLMGYTHWLPEPFEYPGRHEIAVAVDVERFFETFFSVFQHWR